MISITGLGHDLSSVVHGTDPGPNAPNSIIRNLLRSFYRQETFVLALTLFCDAGHTMPS